MQMRDATVKAYREQCMYDNDVIRIKITMHQIIDWNISLTLSAEIKRISLTCRFDANLCSRERSWRAAADIAALACRRNTARRR